MKKIIAMFIAISMLWANINPVFAWKGGTHAFMADMLIEEIKTGTLTLNGAGSFEVPAEVRDAILNYPEAFRAGSLGPDFYPDIFFGQSIIHPEDNGTAGEWIQIMFENYRQMPVDDPEREKSLAFLLGMMMHYSGDIFAHDFVNKWAKGSFPDLTDGATEEEAKIILRHMIIESYIEAKVPHKYKNNMKVNAPKRFILDTFIYNNDIKRAPYIDIASNVRERLIDAVHQFKAFNGDGNVFDYIKYPFTTNYSNYMEYWADDIDIALEEWINTSEKVAVGLTDQSASKNDAIDALRNWQKEYLNYVTPIPDVVIDTFRIPGKAVDAIFTALDLEELREAWSELKKEVFVTAVEAATGMSLEEILQIQEKYEEKLSDKYLFKQNAKENLQKYLKNFGKSEKPLNQEFVAFNNSIVMGKLCLLGADNLNKMVEELSGKKDMFKEQDIIGTYDTFEVTVHTKQNTKKSKYNGTDDDIFFGLRMKDGTLHEMIMDRKNYNDFEGGDKDKYTMKLPQRIKIEDIDHVELRKKSIVDDDWTPTYMKLTYKGTEIKSWDINKTFKGNQIEKFDMKGIKERVYGKSQIDPKILAFVKSLDESNQINLFEFYKNPVLKEKIYDKIFLPEEDFE